MKHFDINTKHLFSVGRLQALSLELLNNGMNVTF